MWHRKLKIRLWSLKTSILREGTQRSGMQMYRAKRVLILPFVKCIMPYKCLESRSSSYEWKVMVNACKKGGEKLSGNTGCDVLLSGVLCVLFYTEILPFFSSLVNSCGQWCMAQSALRNWLLASLTRHFVFFLGCLSHAISRMKAQQTAPRHTLWERRSEHSSREKEVMLHSQPVLGQWVLQKRT